MEIYLDNAATTRPCREAVEAIAECLTENYGNPSSLHRVGLRAQLAVDGARSAVAAALGCEAPQITFTSGATESSNLAIFGAAGAYGRRNKRVITTTVEHASVREAFTRLEQEGFEVVRIAPDADGRFDPAAFAEAVNDTTCLVSMMLVNNETGAILPAADVFRAVKRKNPKVVTHCDAVQGFLKLPIRVGTMQADVMSVSGHKIHAAKGVGALYLKKGVRLKPLLVGGKQEQGLRPGTESVPLIAGMGAAVRALAPTIAKRAETVGALRDTLLAMLTEVPALVVNSPADGSPYILNFSLPGLRSEILLHFLEERGISVSSGSACSKGANSGVLAQFGVKPALTDSALRVSLCAENTADELRALTDALCEGQKTLLRAK